MSAITLFVEMEFKEGAIDEAAEKLKAVASASQAEEGCEMYEFFRVKGEQNKIFLLERWANKEALAAHGESAHLKAAFGELTPKMVKPADMKPCMPL